MVLIDALCSGLWQLGSRVCWHEPADKNQQ